MLLYVLVGIITSILLLAGGYQIAMRHLRTTPGDLRAQRLALDAEWATFRAEQEDAEIERELLTRIRAANEAFFKKQRETTRINLFQQAYDDAASRENHLAAGREVVRKEQEVARLEGESLMV